MEVVQMQMDFTSRANINTERFSRQNRMVANHLLGGKPINVSVAISKYGIYHLHSRIAEVRKEFKKEGIQINDKFIKIGDMVCKEYSI